MNPIRTLIAACILLGVAPVASAEKPNVLFIAMDDLNDWIGCLGGHPQTITPNLDRLAASGMLFRNAYCPAPSCNPSRSAVFSGRPPHRTGLYQNTQKLRDVMPDEVLLPRHFSNHGYWSAGSGKMLHYMIDPQSWDDYFPEKSKDNPFPRSYDPPNRPVSLPVAGPWQYRETDWAALNVTNEQFGGDWLVTKWIGEQLQQPREKPFFLACGIYRPHEPWFVPKQYFEPFPLESIQLPPGYKENDLEDVPAEGQRIARNRYFPHILKHKQWKQGIQAYLASIHFADAMLGRVLDALESSPHRDNTIVVLWSDHGWHLGEKEHWQKFTPWRAAARVPLMIRVPQGTPGLPEGTKPGGLCDRPVNLVDLFDTLTALCGLPSKPGTENHSLIPLLRDPGALWPHAAITHLDHPENIAISTERWRYIRYRDGGEELYDIQTDPHEWTNLASNPEHAATLAEMRTHVPEQIAPIHENQPGIKSLRSKPDLTPAKGTEAPPSNASKTAVTYAAQPPNIVIIFTDDQGYADVGGFGAEGFETPHLDRMAAEGRKFTNFHVAQPVCSASRAALLTGCYPNRIGIHGALGPGSRIGLSSDETTLADLLKAKGYATTAIGKWHLGDHPDFLPLRHGFDSYLGIPYSNDMWPLHPDMQKLPANVAKRRSRFPQLPLIENDRIINPEITASDQAQFTTLFTERAVSFIKDHKEQPFFLYLAHPMPHVPLYVSDKFAGKSQQGLYGDVIMEIDWSVGQILEALEKYELSENTWVIFASDNGPWLSYGHHAGSATPLREGKVTAWEGGTRVPCIMRWPGKIPSGTTSDDMLMTIDLLPTIAKTTGAELPALPIDGRDVSPLVFGDSGARNPHDFYAFYYHKNELHAVATSDGKWKLYLPHSYRTMAGRPGGKDGMPANYQMRSITKPELYHLKTDISESTNVADINPEVVAKLLEYAARIRSNLGDALTKTPPTQSREPGRLNE